MGGRPSICRGAIIRSSTGFDADDGALIGLYVAQAKFRHAISAAAAAAMRRYHFLAARRSLVK